MKRFFLICIALCFALTAGAQKIKTAYLAPDGADQTIFYYKVQYSTDLNVHLYRKDGKLMLNLSHPHVRRPEKIVRLLNPDGTLEPLPDTLRGKAKDYGDRGVFVDDSVEVTVRRMIKHMNTRKLKPYYDNKYKDNEIQPTGGSFWELLFLDKKDKEHHSGGRFYVNSEKLQKEIDSYMEVIRGITLYLLSVDVKYCPQEGDSGKF